MADGDHKDSFDKAAERARYFYRLPFNWWSNQHGLTQALATVVLSLLGSLAVSLISRLFPGSVVLPQLTDTTILGLIFALVLFQTGIQSRRLSSIEYAIREQYGVRTDGGDSQPRDSKGRYKKKPSGIGALAGAIAGYTVSNSQDPALVVIWVVIGAYLGHQLEDRAIN